MLTIIAIIVVVLNIWDFILVMGPNSTNPFKTMQERMEARIANRIYYEKLVRRSVLKYLASDFVKGPGGNKEVTNAESCDGGNDVSPLQ